MLQETNKTWFRQIYTRRLVFGCMLALVTIVLSACHPCQIVNCGPDVLPVSVSIAHDGEIYIHVLHEDKNKTLMLYTISVEKEKENLTPPESYYWSSCLLANSKDRLKPEQIINKNKPIRYGGSHPAMRHEFGPKKITNGTYIVEGKVYEKKPDKKYGVVKNYFLIRGKFSYKDGVIKNIAQ